VDEQSALPRRARYWIAGLTFAFCVGVIASMLAWGNPNNAIHYFSTTAAFGLIVLLLGGLGFGALAGTVAAIIGKK
jgi:hypothetical protein